MNRTLLLIPVLVIALVACREKKLTSNPPPPVPDNSTLGSQTISGNPPVEEDSVVIEHVTMEINTTTTTTNGVTTTTSDTVITTVVLPTDTLCRLMVSFVSKGEGINHAAMGDFDRWLAQDVRGGYTFTKKSWGREGEINYCFNLGAMNGTNQSAFATDVRKFLDGKENVIVSEYVECRGNAVAAENGPEVNTPVTGEKADERLVVSFLSKGNGIDAAAKANLDKYLAKHADVKYKVIHWGREGEMDYVLMIASRTVADQQTIVNDVKTVIGKNDRVLVQENVIPHKANPEDVPPVAVEPVDSNVVRLVVSFISKGQGTDGKTKEEFEKWLGERPQYTYEKTSWGREGEVNYCFRLTNIDGRQQEVFIRDVRTFMADKDLVIVSEWEKCDKRK